MTDFTTSEKLSTTSPVVDENQQYLFCKTFTSFGGLEKPLTKTISGLATLFRYSVILFGFEIDLIGLTGYDTVTNLSEEVSEIPVVCTGNGQRFTVLL